MILEEHVPLAPFTTFRIGGPARFFVRAQSVEEILQALQFARERSLPIFVLGGGSNILVADNGFPGLVLQANLTGITVQKKGEEAIMTAGAGVVWDDLVAYTIKQKLVGLECLSGIPGTVGGAVVANLGAYGAECSDTFLHADVIDLNSPAHEIYVMSKEDCEFSYHKSVFNRMPGRYLVLQATFVFSANRKPRFSYEDHRFNLAAHIIAQAGGEPTVQGIRDEVLRIRAEKGALATSFQSAGSFFRTLDVSAEQQAHIRERAVSLDREKEMRLRPWFWERPNGSFKVAAGFLLEYTEFQKGYVRGAVGISPQHILSIINIAGARAQEIAQLARDMQNAVEKIFTVHLEREVEYIGDVEHGG